MKKHIQKNILKDEYSYKLNFIVNSLYEFKKEINNIIEINQEYIPKIDKACKCKNVERDLKIYSEHNNFLNENKRRFLLEKFLDYKTIRNSGLNDYKNGEKKFSYKKAKSTKDMTKYLKTINLGKKRN